MYLNFQTQECSKNKITSEADFLVHEVTLFINVLMVSSNGIINNNDSNGHTVHLWSVLNFGKLFCELVRTRNPWITEYFKKRIMTFARPKNET